MLFLNVSNFGVMNSSSLQSKFFDDKINAESADRVKQCSSHGIRHLLPREKVRPEAYSLCQKNLNFSHGELSQASKRTSKDRSNSIYEEVISQRIPIELLSA